MFQVAFPFVSLSVVSVIFSLGEPEVASFHSSALYFVPFSIGNFE